MSRGPSSSHREIIPSDAVVMKGHRQVGVIRLPETRADDFVAHFNRTYLAIGLRLMRLPEGLGQIWDPRDRAKKNPSQPDS